MITKTAWKNVWRNKVRSLVVIASVTIGIFAGAFSVAVMEGAMDQRINDALNDEISHIQIANKEFRANNDLNSLIENSDDIEKQIMALDEVESVSERIIVTGMANSASKSTGVMINGIFPSKEKNVLDLYKKLEPGSGEYLDEQGRRNLVYVGEDLARSLNIIRYIITPESLSSLASSGVPPGVIKKLEPYREERFTNEKSFNRELKSILNDREKNKYGALIKESARTYREGSKLTLTFIDRDDYQTGAVFRIAGLYDISNSMFENTQVFVLHSDLQKYTGLADGENHLITVRLKNVENTKEVTAKLKSMFPGLEVLSWREISPDLAMMAEMTKLMYVIFVGIILAALAFGIVNTMLMVVLERTKELGMLAAIGMNKKKIFRMIMLESVFLSLIGGVVGMIFSKVVISLTASKGINFAGYKEGFEAMGYSSHIYPHIGNDFFILVTVMIIVTGILSSVYPAMKALKLDPADALRTE